MIALRHKTRLVPLYLQLSAPVFSLSSHRAIHIMLSPPAPELLRLAPKLVENVIKQVSHRRDLSNVRLTCRTLDKHAAKELFKDVIISPSNEHVHSWSSISQDDIIRQIPRHAIIHTQSDIDDHGMGSSRDRDEDDDIEVFQGALAAMSRFPNLDSFGDWLHSGMHRSRPR
jgi:hypothetical protein